MFKMIQEPRIYSQVNDAHTLLKCQEAKHSLEAFASNPVKPHSVLERRTNTSACVLCVMMAVLLPTSDLNI